jgi:hypothetical protein
LVYYYDLLWEQIQDKMASTFGCFKESRFRGQILVEKCDDCWEFFRVQWWQISPGFLEEIKRPSMLHRSDDGDGDDGVEEEEEEVPSTLVASTPSITSLSLSLSHLTLENRHTHRE